MPPRVSLIVVAAGRGARLGAALPKQYLNCAGKPLLAHALEALAGAHDFCVATVVVHPDDLALYQTALTFLSPAAAARFGPPAYGGASRQQSVLAGLEAQSAAAPDLVLIHDGARIFPSRALIARAIEAAERHGAAIPGIALVDTIKQVDASGRILASPDRAHLRAVQTPQAFRFDLDPGGAPARAERGRRRSDRRRRGRRLGRPCDLRFRRRSGELQSDDA